jgi:hypothetical protein
MSHGTWLGCPFMEATTGHVVRASGGFKLGPSTVLDFSFFETGSHYTAQADLNS